MMSEAAFRKVVLRALYIIMLGVIGDKRADAKMIDDWCMENTKAGGPKVSRGD